MLRVNKFLSDKGSLTKTGTIVDATSGVIHTALCSHAKVPDIEMFLALLHGENKEVIGDRGYCSESDREELRDKEVRLLTPKKWRRKN